jgi:hypothetical protein
MTGKSEQPVFVRDLIKGVVDIMYEGKKTFIKKHNP